MTWHLRFRPSMLGGQEKKRLSFEHRPARAGLGLGFLIGFVSACATPIDGGHSRQFPPEDAAAIIARSAGYLQSRGFEPIGPTYDGGRLVTTVLYEGVPGDYLGCETSRGQTVDVSSGRAVYRLVTKSGAQTISKNFQLRARALIDFVHGTEAFLLRIPTPQYFLIVSDQEGGVIVVELAPSGSTVLPDSLACHATGRMEQTILDLQL